MSAIDLVYIKNVGISLHQHIHNYVEYGEIPTTILESDSVRLFHCIKDFIDKLMTINAYTASEWEFTDKTRADMWCISKNRHIYVFDWKTCFRLLDEPLDKHIEQIKNYASKFQDLTKNVRKIIVYISLNEEIKKFKV